MIDPKLNELPADQPAKSPQTDVERGRSSTTAREGLSINDTIAADANLSLGGRGVDASAVRSGAGAGAGSTFVSPGSAGTPAPNILPGAREAGTMMGPGQNPIGHADTGLPGVGRTERARSGEQTDDYEPAHEEVRTRAYSCWHARGCPEGSPEVDWHTACEQLREERRRQRASSASA